MKRIALILSIFFVFFSFAGCVAPMEYYSLEDYKEKIARSDLGYSDLELDRPEDFLPSQTFLQDFTYLMGEFYLFERSAFEDFFISEPRPSKSFLMLNYEESVYLEAKAFVLQNIPVYEDREYSYGDFQFYVNENFMDNFKSTETPALPKWFTMVCYNDTNNTICFLGFCNAYPKLDDKYMNDLDNNWESFIDTYFGEYYDFSQ